MKALTLLIFLVLSGFAHAEIYIIVDESGNVTYSDTKPRNTESQTIELKPLTPIEKPRFQSPVRASTPPKESSEQDYYSKFQIIEPSNEATIWNQERIAVKVAVQPKLQKGDSVRLLLDGKIVETQKGTDFSLENVYRGEHIITAELLDGQKQVIKSSSNTVYVHRTFIRPFQTQNSGP